MNSPNPTERVLCVLPFAEPRDALARFRARFPTIDITFASARTAEGAIWEDEAPFEGEPTRGRELICWTYLILYS